jgi:hypothetical protein
MSGRDERDGQRARLAARTPVGRSRLPSASVAPRSWDWDVDGSEDFIDRRNR